MTMSDDRDDTDFDLDRVLAVVTGIHPSAERFDRGPAYHLRDQVRGWQGIFCDEPVVDPLVITDVWYLNHRAYESRPIVSIGEPRHNALTAYLTEGLPVAHVEEDRLLIQIDDAPGVPRACIWGDGPALTERAIDLFLDRFIDDWMHAVLEYQAKMMSQSA